MSQRERISRSRTGCFTCRRRKKKCDEKSFPICENCSEKQMVCEWPQLKLDLYKKIKQVKYVNENDVRPVRGKKMSRSARISKLVQPTEPSFQSPSSPQSEILEQSRLRMPEMPTVLQKLTPVGSSSATYPTLDSQPRSSLPWNKAVVPLSERGRRSSYLDKIAMQQDIEEPAEPEVRSTFKYQQGRESSLGSSGSPVTTDGREISELSELFFDSYAFIDESSIIS